MANWWRCLEDMPGLVAVPAAWQQRSETRFETVRTAMLTSAGRAAFYPSPSACECTLRVIDHGDGIVAVSECGSAVCKDIPLAAGEVMLWELSWRKLGHALAAALDCTANGGAEVVAGARQIGSFGGAPLPVLLTIQHDEEGFGNVVARLVARLPKGFILLAPTNRFCTAKAMELLGRVNAGFFDLETHVELLESGKLHAPKTGAELFAAHLPEMKDAVRESDIVRALQMFGGLMGLGTRLKKASPARVFDLMVFKKKTKAETATACKCVASLITRRVELIENHFNMTMEKLIALSSPLQERLRTVKGDRYAKKKHGAMRDEPEQYKDDDDSAPQEEYRHEEGSADD